MKRKAKWILAAKYLILMAGSLLVLLPILWMMSTSGKDSERKYGKSFTCD